MQYYTNTRAILAKEVSEPLARTWTPKEIPDQISEWDLHIPPWDMSTWTLSGRFSATFAKQTPYLQTNFTTGWVIQMLIFTRERVAVPRVETMGRIQEFFKKNQMMDLGDFILISWSKMLKYCTVKILMIKWHVWHILRMEQYMLPRKWRSAGWNWGLSCATPPAPAYIASV